MKKALSLLLSLLMLLSITAGIDFSTQAATGIETKISSIKSKYPNGSYFSKNGKACDHGQLNACSNCRLSNISSAAAKVCGDGNTCWAFANYAFYSIFGISPSDSGNSKKTVSAADLNKTAKIGDYVISLNSSGTKIHYFIYIGANGSNHYRYESNYGVANKVAYKSNNTATGYKGNTSKYTVIHAKNYNSVNGTVTVTNPSVTVKSVSNLANTSVQLNFTANNPSKVTIKTVGVQIRRKGESAWKTKSEAMNSNYTNATSVPMWWTVGNGKEFNTTLYPGITYEYRAYVVYNGKNYYSSTGSFTTKGTHIHSCSTETIKSATCTEYGTRKIYCTICGAYTYETVSPRGHVWNNGTTISNSTCTNEGVKIYTCIGCGEKKTATIAKAAHTYKNYVTKATLTANGKIVNKCSVCGVVKSTTAIPMVKTVTLSATNYNYDGKVKTPAVTVKDSKGKVLRKGTDYDVTYSSGRKNVGKYAVKITLKGNYSGTKTLYFNINPKGTSIVKVTPKSRAFTVSWNKQTSQTTGYQIQYSVYSNFKSVKTITMPKNTYYAKSITGLSGNKRYYVRVRTYKTVKFNGKNYNLYSPWSSAKYTTTKK